MCKKDRSYIATILAICLIAILSFADTGIFVKKFLATTKDGKKSKFNDGEKVNILREIGKGYIVEKDSIGYLIPKENILQTVKEEVVYKVSNDQTPLLDKPSSNAKVIKYLKNNDEVYLEEDVGSYGLYSTGKEQGYILNSHLKKEIRENKLFTYGLSNTNKVLKNGNKHFVLAKGEKVPIRGYEEQHFIIVDENGNEFKIPSKYINLRKSKNIASRNVTIPKRHGCSGGSCPMYKKSANIKLPRISRTRVKLGKYVKKPIDF